MKNSCDAAIAIATAALSTLHEAGRQQWKNISGDGQRFVFTVNVPVNVTAR